MNKRKKNRGADRNEISKPKIKSTLKVTKNQIEAVLATASFLSPSASPKNPYKYYTYHGIHYCHWNTQAVPNRMRTYAPAVPPLPVA